MWRRPKIPEASCLYESVLTRLNPELAGLFGADVRDPAFQLVWRLVSPAEDAGQPSHGDRPGTFPHSDDLVWGRLASVFQGIHLEAIVVGSASDPRLRFCVVSGAVALHFTDLRSFGSAVEDLYPEIAVDRFG